MYREHGSSYEGGEPAGAAHSGPLFYTEATAVALHSVSWIPRQVAGADGDKRCSPFRSPRIR